MEEKREGYSQTESLCINRMYTDLVDCSTPEVKNKKKIVLK